MAQDPPGQWIRGSPAAGAGDRRIDFKNTTINFQPRPSGRIRGRRSLIPR